MAKMSLLSDTFSYGMPTERLLRAGVPVIRMGGRVAQNAAFDPHSYDARTMPPLRGYPDIQTPAPIAPLHVDRPTLTSSPSQV
jgi:hypothetical protein